MGWTYKEAAPCQAEHDMLFTFEPSLVVVFILCELCGIAGYAGT